MTIVYTKNRDWYLLGLKLQVKAIASATQLYVLNNSVKQSTPRDWLPVDFTAEKEPLPIMSVDNEKSFDLSNQCVNGWISLVRDALYSNSSVEDIFVSIEDNNVDVWVAIPKRDISVLRQLVEIEGRILEMLVSGEHPAFLIDFHVIYRCGRNIKEMVSNRAIKLPRQV